MFNTITIQEHQIKGGFIRALPSTNDYTMKHPRVYKAYQRAGVYCGEEGLIIPADVDISEYDSPVENQESTGACTAHAGVALIEHMERKVYGKYIDHSRKFLYKTSRKLIGLVGDVGCTIPATLAAIVLFGTPPEIYWSWSKGIDDDPEAFEYSIAQNYQGTSYVNLSPIGATCAQVLYDLKVNITAGFPVMFGFPIYSSIDSCGDGYIKYPLPGESETTGHAVLAVGFNDTISISNGSYTSIGAVYIKNSWSTNWGINGYGWLPYDYFTNGLATDLWTLVNQEWVELGQFGIYA